MNEFHQTRGAHSRRLFAAVVALALVAAACGSDTKSSSNSLPASSASSQDPAASKPAATTAAVGSAPAETSSAGTGTAVKDFSVGVALGGSRNDQSYFQSVFEGAQRGAKDHGAKLTVVDNLIDETAAGDAIRNLSNNTVVVVDITLFASLVPVAEQNPKTTYIVSSGFFAPGDVPKNVHGYVDVYGWATYPMGQIAAKLSKTGKLGYITGGTFPIERTALAGFTEGAKSINPNIQVVETVVSNTADVAGAKQATAAQISSGVDIVYGFIDAGFVGLQQAADESGKDISLFGVVVDRCDRGKNIVGNNLADYTAVVAGAIDDFASGNLPSPTRAYGLENEKMQQFNLCPTFQTPELVKLAKETVAAIKDGSLKLPASVTAQK